MTKALSRPLLAVLFLIAGTVAASAQQKPSEAAYLRWKLDRQNVQESRLQPSHVGVGISVSKYQTVGVRAEFSVFSEADVFSAPNLQFTVQPLATVKDAGGKTELVEVGPESKLAFQGSSALTRKANGLFAQPELIGRVPAEAKAVRVTVLGADGGNGRMSVILPLGESEATAVLSKN